jgi:hypothetical protein
VLDALALVLPQIFLDLALVVEALEISPVSLPSMLKKRISRKLNSFS